MRGQLVAILQVLLVNHLLVTEIAATSVAIKFYKISPFRDILILLMSENTELLIDRHCHGLFHDHLII